MLGGAGKLAAMPRPFPPCVADAGAKWPHRRKVVKGWS